MSFFIDLIFMVKRLLEINVYFVMSIFTYNEQMDNYILLTVHTLYADSLCYAVSICDIVIDLVFTVQQLHKK